MEKFLPLLDCIGSKSTIERDGTGAKMAGLLFFVDVERSRLICVEPVNEEDSLKVRRHVQKVMQAVGGEQLPTDEVGVYDRIVADGFHKVCLAHWRKSRCRRAWQLYRQLKAEGMEFESADMLKLLELLKAEPRPPTLPEAVERLVRRYINCRKGLVWKFNELLEHIERTKWFSHQRL